MGFGNFIDLLRRVDRLLALKAKHGQVIATLQADLEKFRASVARLEVREEIVVVEAKTAASAAAVQVAVASVAEIARRVGALEERSGQGSRARKRIDPPSPPPPPVAWLTRFALLRPAACAKPPPSLPRRVRAW